mmetsp:Transcript_48379/g.113229  ORF Transcript_48379/g.113229 Transcript_48379/m.113229 type:complete len:92 (+) Transcript_48379:229-504(+)
MDEGDAEEGAGCNPCCKDFEMLLEPDELDPDVLRGEASGAGCTLCAPTRGRTGDASVPETESVPTLKGVIGLALGEVALFELASAAPPVGS